MLNVPHQDAFWARCRLKLQRGGMEAKLGRTLLKAQLRIAH